MCTDAHLGQVIALYCTFKDYLAETFSSFSIKSESRPAAPVLYGLERIVDNDREPSLTTSENYVNYFLSGRVSTIPRRGPSLITH